MRELSRALKQAMLVCDGPVIKPEHLSLPEPVRCPSFRTQLQHLERRQLEETLARTSGNITAAARLLKLSRSTLFDRLKKLGIRRMDYLEGKFNG